MTWVAVAIGGSALIGAGASYAGSKKQSDASKAAGNLNLEMFQTLNRQQQPFVQSGYGAMGRLNTLLGLSPSPTARPRQDVWTQPWPDRPGYAPTPGGGVQPIMQTGPQGGRMQIPERSPNMRLNQLLAMRAANGDRQAQAILQGGV